MKTSLRTVGTWFIASALFLTLILALPAHAETKEPKPARFVYVSGEVKVPQRYVYTEGLTVTKAIRQAKGVTAQASEKITLQRAGAKDQTFTLKQLQGKDVPLQADDRLFVPRKD